MVGYELVWLANGVRSIRDLRSGETFHPVIGPAAEAEALYVRQLRLRERLRACREVFVLWDVGLGAGANVLTALKALSDVPGQLHIVSFDRTLEALKFALKHADDLGYLATSAQRRFASKLAPTGAATQPAGRILGSPSSGLPRAWPGSRPRGTVRPLDHRPF